MIYLDHNASTPVDPEVADAVHSVLRTNFGNPSSGHDIGLRAKASMEKARLQVAELIGASPPEVVFTSGGTEANNLAIIGTALKKKKGHIITSLIEHPSVMNPCRHLEAMGFGCTYVGVNHEGRVALEDIRKAIRKDTFLITIMHANNETGVFQPVEEIGALAREKGISIHTDAAQTVGKVPVNVEKLNVDMLTVATHKFYGPKGIGALYMRKGIELNPLLFGAGHERGLKPGTENVPGIAGLGKACEMAGIYMKDRVSHTKKLTTMLCNGLMGRISGLRINGHETLRLPNTLNVCIPGVNSTDLLEMIKNNVAASSGSACHAGENKPSAVLMAMGISEADAMSSIRLSTGKDTTEEEIRESVEIIDKAVQALIRS
ncbi:MAG TPA: cysteine desulfurase family protein [Thermodesulfovibrionales bacterium]|nr:cysteine desulfurase family protein [Thermodesulfovibrionales bacterium]